ncbi:hypothetical protein TrST_g12035 [Triparma strigata]|uniref:BspA family leucine-rich repeat surface protein n=1 Tax=Triparma strigata TaxID=1606541 RepID=A0A9W7A5J4_9STRA|nr:hypothetical protein TrST_g12035 [Triparma strigata]
MTVAALKAELDRAKIRHLDSSLATFIIAEAKRRDDEMRARIPQLNEDVQGYIVSFLSGFDELHAASQLARGFRAKAKPRLDSMLKRSDADVKIAAKAWCEDAEAAREIYGHISIWNTSEVTDMRDLFSADEHGYEAAEQFNGDLSSWDVSNVTTMESMLQGASAFNGDLSSWDVSNVTNMEGMFNQAKAFNGDLSTWNLSNVTTMLSMFEQALTFNGDLSSWDVSNVTTMEGMFQQAEAFNGDLSSWDVSNVTTMAGMFAYASSFDRLTDWDLEGKNTLGMFEK